jgi:hypothetical protein
VFTSGTKRVASAWMPKGATDVLRFTTPVKVVDILTRTKTELAANTAFTLTDKPVLIEDLPPQLLRDAAKQRTRPYPWSGETAPAALASIELGPSAMSRGIRLEAAEMSDPHTFADGSKGALVNVGRGNALHFAVNPAFAGFRTRDVFIRVTARTVKPTPAGRSTGMNLFYQPSAGSPGEAPQYPYKNAGIWWTVPNDDQWHTTTWHLTDAMFVHTFGSSFYLVFDNSVPFVIGKVELSKKPF